MCFVSCKKEKKLTREQKAKKKIDSQKALAKAYTQILDKTTGKYINFRRYGK